MNSRRHYYPVPYGEGTLHLHGCADAAHLVLMCAGFPDDETVFQPMAEKLAQSAHSFVGIMCLPGYESSSNFHLARDGYTFLEWVVYVQEAVKSLRALSTNPEAKLIGVFHDWGCLAGHMFANRAVESNLTDIMFDRLVLFDVLLPPHPRAHKPLLALSPREKLFLQVGVLYQVVLAMIWLMQRYVNRYMAWVAYTIWMQVLGLLGLLPICPDEVSNLMTRYPKQAFTMLYRTYPYYGLWKAILGKTIMQSFAGAFLPLDLNRTPVLFMYGAAKPFALHDHYALAIIEQNGYPCRVVSVEQAGHWLFLQQPELCFQHVKDFILEASASMQKNNS